MQPAKGTVLMDVEEEGEDGAASRAGEEGEDGAREEDDDTVTEQTHHIVIPSYSAWFDYNCVHSIERRGLPEFFNSKNSSKTSEV